MVTIFFAAIDTSSDLTCPTVCSLGPVPDLWRSGTLLIYVKFFSRLRQDCHPPTYHHQSVKNNVKYFAHLNSMHVSLADPRLITA